MEKWSVPCGYATLDDVLEREQFDVVSVCGPTARHIAHLVRLLDADVEAVFVEKPLDGAARAARAIGDKFSSRRVPVAVNFTCRFDPVMHDLRDAIRLVATVRCTLSSGGYSGDLLNKLAATTARPRRSTPSTGHVPVAASRTARAGLQRTDGRDIVDGRGRRGIRGHRPSEVRHDTFRDRARMHGRDHHDRRCGPGDEDTQTVVIRRVSGEVVPDRGQWTASQYGSAMLAALDELANWRDGTRGSSDIASACDVIELVDSPQCKDGRGMSKLALLGGKQVRTEPFPAYAVIGEDEKEGGCLCARLWDSPRYLGEAGTRFLWAVPMCVRSRPNGRDSCNRRHAIAVNRLLPRPLRRRRGGWGRAG